MHEKLTIYRGLTDSDIQDSAVDDAKVYGEILTAESEYIDELNLLITGYIKPLTRWADELEVIRDMETSLEPYDTYSMKQSSPPLDLNTVDVTVLSSNLHDIFSCHCTMVTQLESAWDSSGLIGVLHTLKNNLPMSLSLHSTYLYNLEPLRRKLVEVEKKPSVMTFIHALDLRSFLESEEEANFRSLLMAPVYHVLHYHLIPFLRNDNSFVALNRLYHVANRIMEESYHWGYNGSRLALKHIFEPFMIEIVSTQRFVREGMLMLLGPNGPVPHKFLLFQEAILFGCETKMGKYGREQYIIDRAIDISRCYIVDDLNFGSSCETCCSFMIMSPSVSVVATAVSQVEKEVWYATLAGLIHANRRYHDNSVMQDHTEQIESTWSGSWMGSLIKKAHIIGGGKPKSQGVSNGNGHQPNVGQRKTSACPTYEPEDVEQLENRLCNVWIMDENHSMTQCTYIMPGMSYGDVGDGASTEFIEVLENPHERAIFRKHLQASHCVENLMFWEMVTDFRNNGYVGQPQAMTAAAGVIIHRFMQEGSPDQESTATACKHLPRFGIPSHATSTPPKVNISSYMREQVLSNFASGNVTIDIFEDSLREILKILERDSFLHFCSSPYFAELLELRLMTPSGELKERACGVIKFSQLIANSSSSMSPVSDSVHSTRQLSGSGRFGSGRYPNTHSLVPKTPSTVTSDGDNVYNTFDDFDSKDPDRVNSLAAMDNALGKAAYMDLWSAKEGMTHEQWMKKFKSNAEYFPASLSVSDMTKPGAPLIYVNREFTSLTGYPKEMALGKNCSFMQGPESEPESIQIIRDKLSKAQDCYVCVTNYKRNGEKFLNLLSLRPVFDTNEIYRFAIGVQFEVLMNKTMKRRVNQLDNLLRLLPRQLQVSSFKKRTQPRLELLVQAIGSDLMNEAVPRGISVEEQEQLRIRDAFDSTLTLEAALNEAAVNKVWSTRSSANSHEWLHKFMNSTESFPASICVSEMTKPGSPLIFVNQQFCKLTGYSKDEVLGANCRFLQGPETESEAVIGIRNSLGKGQECHVRLTNYRKNGSSFQNLLSLKPIFDVYGVYKFVIGVQFEVTVDVSLNKRLNQLERLLSLIPGKLQTFTNTQQSDSGVSRIDLLFRAISAANDDNDIRSCRDSESGSPAPKIAKGLGNFLGLRPRTVSASATGFSESLLQNTAKVWGSKTADTAEEWLRNFVSAAEDFPASITVASMTIPGVPLIYVNSCFTEVTGYSAAEAVGRNCKFLQGMDSEYDSIAMMCSSLSRGVQCHVKITNYRKNGERFQNLISLKPIFDASGTFKFTVGIQFEVIVNRSLRKKLMQLDSLMKSIPSKLQMRPRTYAQRCSEMMTMAIGAASLSEAIAQGCITEEVEESRYQLGPDTLLENALNMLMVQKGWSSRNAMDANDWLRNFTSTADGFPTCMVVSDMTLPGVPIIFVNQAFTVVTGYSREECVGRNCRFLQGPDTEPDAVDTIRRHLSQAQECQVRLTNYRKNGEKFVNLLSLKPVFDAGGVYRYVIGVQFEVIPDKTLKRRIGQLEKLLQLMPTKLQTRRRSATEAESDLYSIAVTTNTAVSLPTPAAAAAETGSGRQVGAMAIMEGALRKIQRSNMWGSLVKEDADAWLPKFSETVENFPAPVVVTAMISPGAPLVYVNPEFCRLTGYLREEAVGRNCRFLQGPDSEAQAVAHIRDKMSRGLDCSVRITNYRKNGDKFRNLLSLKPVHDSKSNYIYVVGVLFEVLEDETLTKRLNQLERMLRLIPSRLEGAPWRSPAAGFAHNRVATSPSPAATL